MPFVTRACFFVHVHKKFAYWPWSWHLFRSPWTSFRMLTFFVHGAHLSRTDEETLTRKKSFFARFFVFVPKKNCIFIRIIRSVHAMLRTCKKWHHVHAMLCTRFCIKKKWTSHSSQIIIVSEQGKTITRRVAKFATSYSVFHFPAIWSVTLNKPWNPIGHFVFSVASPSRVFGLVYQKPWVIPFFFLDTSLD